MTLILSALLVLFTQLQATYCMAGNDDVMFNNSFGVLLASSQYCFVNESTIRINSSNVNIINNTGDWIMANNDIYLFIAPANGTNCTSNTSENSYSNAIYIIQILILSFGILVSAAIVTLHLLIKDLQTVSGVLIVLFCILLILNFSLSMAQTSLANQRNGNACAVMFYIGITLYFVYDTTKLSLLVQFAYLMYQSFKASETLQNKRSTLCKYAIFIALLSVICSTSGILVDVLISRAAFRTTHGRCIPEIDPSNFKTASVTLLLVQIFILNAVKISFMIAGLVLYYLTTRSCCSIPLRDVKVAIVLNSTTGINNGVIILLYLLRVSGDLNFAITLTSILIEQMLLFLVFFTSKKVWNHIYCNCAKEIIKSSEEHKVITKMIYALKYKGYDFTPVNYNV